MIRRVIYVYSFMMLFLLIAALGTASAALGHSAYTEAVGRQSTYTLQAAVSRGTIYDRNLQPLTNAQEKYIAAVVPSVETLSRINAITDDDKRDELRTALENGKPFTVEVNSPVSTDGIQTFTVAERYSAQQPASNLIGYLQNGTTGVSGLEKSFNSILSADQGKIKVTFTVDAIGQVIHSGALQTENTYKSTAAGIALTIDREIQTALETACAEIHKGAAVILECATGQIMALASFPALDPNHLESSLNDTDAPFINRALTAYAPGSIFKLISAAAALESGTDYRKTYVCAGTLAVDGMDFACYDHIAHGEINMHTAIRQSCNGYFIQLVAEIGAERVLAMAEALGIGQEIELAEGLSAAKGTLSSAGELQNPRAAANFSFGQGETTLTPLHAAAYINAIAAGGIYVTPQVYWGTVDEDRNVSGFPQYESRKVMEATTANRLRAYMESTARFGTAKKGAPENCTAGIKTGTAQTGVHDENGEEILNYWYAGYICDGDDIPAYTVVIMEESSSESNVPAAFKKITETLVDFI